MINVRSLISLIVTPCCTIGIISAVLVALIHGITMIIIRIIIVIILINKVRTIIIRTIMCCLMCVNIIRVCSSAYYYCPS